MPHGREDDIFDPRNLDSGESSLKISKMQMGHVTHATCQVKHLTLDTYLNAILIHVDISGHLYIKMQMLVMDIYKASHDVKHVGKMVQNILFFRKKKLSRKWLDVVFVPKNIFGKRNIFGK